MRHGCSFLRKPRLISTASIGIAAHHGIDSTLGRAAAPNLSLERTSTGMARRAAVVRHPSPRAKPVRAAQLERSCLKDTEDWSPMARLITASLLVTVGAGCAVLPDTETTMRGMYNVASSGTSKFDGTKHIRVSNMNCTGTVMFALYQDTAKSKAA